MKTLSTFIEGRLPNGVRFSFKFNWIQFSIVILSIIWLITELCTFGLMSIVLAVIGFGFVCLGGFIDWLNVVAWKFWMIEWNPCKRRSPLIEMNQCIVEDACSWRISIDLKLIWRGTEKKGQVPDIPSVGPLICSPTTSGLSRLLPRWIRPESHWAIWADPISHEWNCVSIDET